MTSKPINIAIVSDVSCPWCIIGYSALAKAIESLDLQADVSLSWKPFELNPQMPDQGQDTREHLQEKYGATAEQSAQTRAMMKARGEEVGFSFNFKENGRIYNTFDAHRLLCWAQTEGKQTELKLALFDLYFSLGGNPSSHDHLLAVVSQIGLDRDSAEKVLASDQYSQQVRLEQEESRQMGITAVPTFIVNDQYMISGGQPEEAFKKMLVQVSQEAKANAAAQ